jgi:class 3 adenylate cyclase
MRITSPTHALFQRFPDRALERRYRHEQRARQGKFTRAMVLLALGAMLLYWAINFALLERGAALAILAQQLVFLPILVGYLWFIGRPAYADGWWADILLFAAIQPSMLKSMDTMVATGSEGWSFNARLCYGLQMAMAFACLCFPASVPAFFFLTVSSIAYVALVLVARGYTGDAVVYTVQNYAMFAIVLFYVNWAIDDKARSLFAARISLDAERQKSERLLTNVLPAPVAERLKSQERIADRFDDLTVIFVDLVGFTTLSEKLGAERIVELLNAYFECADHACDLFELEKVNTIGDAYRAVAGAITQPPRPAKAAVDFAVHLRGAAAAAGRGFGVDLRLHAGIARGPAIGGVISAKRISYDYWGPTINLGARLMDAAGADGVAVSEAVHRAVADSYPFVGPRRIALKGLGETAVYDLDLAAG